MLWNSDRASEYLGLGPRRVKALVEQRRLRAINVGSVKRPVYRFRPEDLNEVLPPEVPLAPRRRTAVAPGTAGVLSKILERT